MNHVRGYNWRKHQEYKHIKRRIILLEAGRCFYGGFYRNRTKLVYEPKWYHFIGTPVEYFHRSKNYGEKSGYKHYWVGPKTYNRSRDKRYLRQLLKEEEII